MAPRNRIIIDTDPGVDDVLAILLALAAREEELEVTLISVTFGNIDVRNCLRNVVTTFHVLERELKWRREHGKPAGFDGMTKFKPLVAIGAQEPLLDRVENADYFHGTDGLGGIHTTHPHLSPEDTWKHLFEQPPADSVITDAAKDTGNLAEPTFSFKASSQPAHKEMLRILRENEPDTITIIAIGPLTNCALAAAEDPEAFLRAKEVVTMGGAVDATGNEFQYPNFAEHELYHYQLGAFIYTSSVPFVNFAVSPVAEFNVFADAFAAARVYALTSPNPSSTMPPLPIHLAPITTLPPYPLNLSRQLRLTMLSLDTTENHVLSRAQFESHIAGPLKSGSPLAEWLSAFMTPMLDKMETLHIGHSGKTASLALHDPLTVWYVLTRDTLGWDPSPAKPHFEDIRVETSGQWTKGMTLVDRRTRHRRNSDGPVPHDRDNWLGNRSGNQVLRLRKSGFEQQFGEEMMKRILGGL